MQNLKHDRGWRWELRRIRNHKHTAAVALDILDRIRHIISDRRSENRRRTHPFRLIGGKIDAIRNVCQIVRAGSDRLSRNAKNGKRNYDRQKGVHRRVKVQTLGLLDSCVNAS